MPMLFFNLLKDFGVEVAGFAVICFLLWKIMANHLTHIATDIKNVLSKVDTIDEKLNKTIERVAILEGMKKRRSKKSL